MLQIEEVRSMPQRVQLDGHRPHDGDDRAVAQFLIYRFETVDPLHHETFRWVTPPALPTSGLATGGGLPAKVTHGPASSPWRPCPRRRRPSGSGGRARSRVGLIRGEPQRP